MKEQKKPSMPDYVVVKGDGTVTDQETVDLKPPRPQPEPERPEDSRPEASAGSTPRPAGDPTGAHALEATGGGKPQAPAKKVARELAEHVGMPAGQRGKEDKKEESGSAVVSKALAPQLGSAPEFLNRQQIDERKICVITAETQTPYNYLAFRGYIDKVRFWSFFVDAELVTSQGIGGLGRRHILRAIEASSGAQVSETAKKPGILARNLWSRAWKREALAKGQEVEENE